MSRRLLHFLKTSSDSHAVISYFILFEIAFILFYFLQNQNTFADPDSFYHAKMAVLFKEQGIVREFPWVQFTILKEYFADHHFLYHLLLVPFVAILPPLVGVKLATIVFASMTVLAFYWLLQKFSVRGAWFYALVLIISASFIFRVNLAKAQAVALVAYLAGLYLIDRKRHYALAVFSFVYVWLYGGWPLVYVLFFARFCAGILQQYSVERKNWKKGILAMLAGTYFHFDGEKAWQWIRSCIPSFFYITLGVVAGLLINPYFPKNLFFYWHQIFKIALVGSGRGIAVGGEWYPYNPLELMSSASVAFIVFIVALTFFFLTWRKQSTRSVTLFLLSVLFFFLTLKSRRNVEYLIPTMLLFSGVALTTFAHTVHLKSFYREVIQFFLKQKKLMVAACIPLAIIPYVVARDYVAVRKTYAEGQAFDKFKMPSEWLKTHTPKGSLVFHSDWDEFPLLFYHNSHNYYLVGLDPTFMYNYSETLFEKWRRITLGEEKENLYAIIKNDFSAEYVFVNVTRHQKFDENMKDNFLFEEVYRDSTAKIYKVL